jgi:hypothetical protein
VLLFGVGVATVTDLQLNAMGSVLSLLAIVTTCIAQIVSFRQLFVIFYFKTSLLDKSSYMIINLHVATTCHVVCQY